MARAVRQRQAKRPNVNEATEPRAARSSRIGDPHRPPSRGFVCVRASGTDRVVNAGEPGNTGSACVPTTDVAEPFDRRFGSTAAMATWGRRVPCSRPNSVASPPALCWGCD